MCDAWTSKRNTRRSLSLSESRVLDLQYSSISAHARAAARIIVPPSPHCFSCSSSSRPTLPRIMLQEVTPIPRKIQLITIDESCEARGSEEAGCRWSTVRSSDTTITSLYSRECRSQSAVSDDAEVCFSSLDNRELLLTRACVLLLVPVFFLPKLVLLAKSFFLCRLEFLLRHLEVLKAIGECCTRSTECSSLAVLLE